MKIQKILTQTEELEIIGAKLLSIEEAKELPIQLRKYEDWWWLITPSCFYHYVAIIEEDGSIDEEGIYVEAGSVVVRPALQIQNIRVSNLQIGDAFIFGDKKFEVISENLAFCVEDIGNCCFREDGRAKDANKYEKSDVKKFVDDWFEEANNE